jgi:hypothetical protein
MVRDPRILVAIADYEDDRYVQFWVEEDFIVAEVVSSINICGGDALTQDQERQLEAAGWSVPDEDAGYPNWRRQGWGLKAMMNLADATADASTRILKQGTKPDLQTVMLRTFSVTACSPKRQLEASEVRATQEEINATFQSLVARCEGKGADEAQDSV